MSTTLVSSIYEMDILFQNQKNNVMKTQYTAERKIVGNSVNLTRNRNLHVPVGSNNVGAFNNFIPIAGPRVNGTTPMPDDNTVGLFEQHRKLERSLSDQRTINDQERFNQNALNSQRTNINTSRYKTELCRPFEESGYCKYSDKCQFAHGLHELRSLARHPKYKTEPCRTFHTIGFCPYGARCHFIHSEDEKKLNQIVNKNQQAQMNQVSSIHQQQCPQQMLRSSPPPAQRPDSISLKINFSCRGSMGSSLDSSPPSSVTDSPTSLSPTCWTEDFHPLCTNNSSNPSPTQSLSGNSSASPSPVFNFNGSNTDSITALPSLLTPLNVQTQLNNADLSLFAQHFQSVLKINNNSNSQPVFRGDSLDLTRSPPSPPDSISSDSIGSTNSVPSYGVYAHSSSSSSSHTCASALDVGKNLRLPIFSQLSHDGC